MADHQEGSVVKVLILTWPNLITLLRIFAVPVIIWLILSDYMVYAFWLTIIAGLSDVLDGFLARISHTSTVFGSYLDPIADKCLLVSLYLTLGFNSCIADWLVILIVFRDLLIISGVSFLLLMHKKLNLVPLQISKINTFVQLLCIVWVLGDMAFGFNMSWVLTIFSVAIAVTTVLSAIGYVVLWLRYALLDRAENGIE